MRFFLMLLMCFAPSVLLAQTKEVFSIQDVGDSLHYIIKIEEDLKNDITVFSSPRDTIRIFGVRGSTSIKLHNGIFLEATFRLRGGTGLKLRRTVILCTSKGKVFRALDFPSQRTYRLTEVYDKIADSLKIFDELEDYHTSVLFDSLKRNRYNLSISEFKEIKSKHNPLRNIKFEKSYELQFDRTRCFFFNSMELLNGQYTFYSVYENKSRLKHIHAKVPCLKLYENRYLFIDNEWYRDNGNGLLSSM